MEKTQTEKEKEKEPEPEPQPEPQELVKARFKFESSQDFKKILQALATFNDEITFRVSMDGISTLEMDPTRVAMIELLLPKHVFEEFSCFEEGQFTLNVQDLIDRRFKNLYKDEAVEFVFNNGKAHITLKGFFERHFSATLLEPPDEETPKPKNLTFTAQVKLITKTVQQILKDFNNPASLIATSEGIRFSQRSDYDVDPYFVDLKRGSEGLLDIQVSTPTKATYSDSYLREFVNAIAQLSELFTLAFARDMPLKCTCHLLGTMPFTFWMAPRISDED